MNPKTTLVLAVVLLAVVGVIWLTGGDEPVAQAPPKTTTQLLEETPLVADDALGDAVKIVCQRGDEPEWTFERVTEPDAVGQPEWKMTTPVKVPATAWQVNGIARRISQLKYKLRYPAEGPGAMTPLLAGLDPPASTITLHDDQGRSIKIAIGRKPADNQTYVRLDGAGDIYAVNTALDTLLKKQAIEYRDQQIFKFNKQHAKRLEITERPEEGEPVTYVLVRSDAGWTFEQPVKAVAVAEKIDAAVSTLSGLRVSAWVEDQADNLAMYGLEGPGLTVRVTVEEPAEPAADASDESPDSSNDNTEAEAPAPEPVIRELVVNVARRSPIGQATNVYVCPEGERAVGTVSKTLADRLMPNMAEWRDMRLSRVAVAGADSIELTTPQGNASFKKESGLWVDADSGTGVETSAVTELLSQIDELKARNFVETASGDEQTYGLDEPQATIRLNVPGEPEPQRFVVGGFTDPQRRRMVYVRHNEGRQIAKVRVADVNKLTRDPAEYRDRTVFNLPPDRFQRVAITRQDELTGEPFSFALTRSDNRLVLTEPAAAETSDEQVKKLTTALGGLKATKVMPDASPADFGLEAPTVTCEITFRPPEVTRYVEADEPGEDGEELELRPETYQPPDETLVLLVARSDGQTYAKRQDRPTVYLVAQRILNLLQAEFHEPAIMRFEESQVVGVKVTNADGTTHEFAKRDDQWSYAPEPDLPIDPKRVQDLLLRLKDLKTQRVIAYNVEDLAQYGLDEAQASVSVTLEDGGQRSLLVSAQVCDADAAKRRYATLAGSGEVFLVSADTVRRFEVDLAEFEAP